MSSTALAVAAFFGTTFLFVVSSMQPEGANTDGNGGEALTKEQVQSLRARHFSKRVSVSYANSGPLLIVGGSGSRLTDETGRSYLDTRNNVAHCGHGHPRIVQAVQEQVAVLNTNTRYLHPHVVTLAKRLARLLPDPLEVVFFCNSGSEANDLALRLARAYNSRNSSGSSCCSRPNTIVVDGAYHGHTLATLDVSPYKYEHSREYSLRPPSSSTTAAVDHGDNHDVASTPGEHVWKVPCPDMYRGMYSKIDDDDDAAATKYANHVREACNFYVDNKKASVSAFIVEGGMGVAGVILPPRTYLQQCIEAVHSAGGVYIADEVQTGFGRLGTCFWAFQYQHSPEDESVVPDIVTVGKPFGNGMPLAAVVTSRTIADAFDAMGVEYFNTFGGNPVCAAAGLAVLDVIESEQLQERANNVGSYLKSKLIDLKSRCSLIGDVRGSGLFLGVELVRNRETLEPATEETSFLCTILKEKYSILTSIDGFYENVFVIKPPMCFSQGDADEFVSCFERAILYDLAEVEDVRRISKTPT